VVDEGEGLLDERAAVFEGVRALFVEPEAVSVEVEALPVERGALRVQPEAVSVEREPVYVEREVVSVERGAVPGEGEAVPVDRDAVSVEREAVPVDREARWLNGLGALGCVQCLADAPRARSTLGVLRETGEHHIARRTTEDRVLDRRRCRERLARERQEHGGSLEGIAPREHLVREDPEREHVGRRIEALPSARRLGRPWADRRRGARCLA